MKRTSRTQWQGMVKNKLLVILVILFLNTSLYPQYANIRFKHLSLEDGLSQSGVTCILQDRKGYLWFGTHDGLNRYDGYKFKIYNNEPKDPTTISDCRIECIFEDSDGFLWVGTLGGGLNRFDWESDRFFNLKNNPDATAILKDHYVKTICEGPEGILWIGFYDGGLLRFDKKNDKFTAYVHSDQNSASLIDNNVNIVHVDENGILWIGTGKGLDSFDYKKNEFLHYKPIKSPHANPACNNVSAIFAGKKGRFWIGTKDGGIYNFDCQTGHFSPYNKGKFKSANLIGNLVWCILEDKDILWIGTLEGLIRLDLTTGDFYTYKADPSNTDSISINKIFTIYRDKTGILWFGTHGGGIDIFDKAFQRFKLYAKNRGHFKGLSDDRVWAIFEDSKDKVWIGTYREGLNRFDRKTCRFYRYLGKEDIRCIHEDKNTGFLWLGTRYNGLIKFDPKKGEVCKHYKKGGPNTLSSNELSCIFQNRPDVMWIGTNADGGLNKFNLETETFTVYKHRKGDPNSLGSGRTRMILEDKVRKGTLWLGTGGGLNRFDLESETFTLYRHENKEYSLSHNRVTTILQDSKNRLWLGTEGGLNLLVDAEKGKFKSYGLLNSETPNDTIFGILEDNDANLWISTTNGLFKFSYKIKKDNEIIKVKYFDDLDGLQSKEFESGAYFKSKSGEMFFGGVKGLNSFFPGEIKNDNCKPLPVIIESISFNKKSILMPKKTMRYTFKGTGDFSVGFTAPSFISPKKVTFNYKLKGFETEWNTLLPGKDRVVHYNELRPGSYRFMVMAGHADGEWNENGTSVDFTLQPFFYQTLLFKIVLFLLGLSILIAVLYIYRRGKVENSEKHKKPNLHPDFAEECIKKLKDLMESDKIYRDTEISLQILANKISIKPYLLSQIINEHLNRNFYDLVNSYRIEEAKQILVRPGRLKLNVDQVAYEVGFKTRAAFHKAFKKYTGRTPRQYKKTDVK